MGLRLEKIYHTWSRGAPSSSQLQEFKGRTDFELRTRHVEDGEALSYMQAIVAFLHTDMPKISFRGESVGFNVPDPKAHNALEI